MRLHGVRTRAAVLLLALACAASAIALAAPRARAATPLAPGWFLLGPVSAGPVTHLEFTSPDAGRALSESSLVVTTDGGVTWTSSRIPGADYWNAIDFVSADEGWAAGTVLSPSFPNGGPAIAHTTDGGTTWTAQSAPADVPPWTSLSGVSFATPLDGWIAGSPGLILHTSDGGATWTRQALPDPGEMSGLTEWTYLKTVDAIDADEACVVGAREIALHTVDAGATWTLTHEQDFGDPNEWELRDVDFSGRHGIAVSDMGTVLVSSDGGATWDAQWLSLPPDPDTGEYVFLSLLGVTVTDADHAWIAGSSASLFSTSDGGATWTRHDVGGSELLGLGYGVGLYSVATLGDRVWAGGMNGAVIADYDPAPSDDAIPPVTTDDADDLWHNRDVTVALSATDDASGVASTEYRIDGGPWTAGTSVTIAAPSDHSGDGLRVLQYRSTDNAGNVEATRTRYVRIDTLGPTLDVPAVTTIAKKLPFSIWVTATDARSPMAHVTVRVFTVSGGGREREVASATADITPWGYPSEVRFARGLSMGTYRVEVSGTDLAGNPQQRTALGRLVVGKSGATAPRWATTRR